MELVKRQYELNMRYLDDPSIKGDITPRPRGALGMLVREQQSLRRMEFLNFTNNPTDIEIMGIRGRANLYREVARGLDMPEGSIIPSDEDIERRIQGRLAAEAAQAQLESAGAVAPVNQATPAIPA